MATGAAVAAPAARAQATVPVRPNEPGPYDLVIAGGRVIDPETGLDAVRDVGIIAGRVAAISETPLTGTARLDAAGQIVAPGFIDLHAHAQQLPAAWMQVFDGVTTALELESGLLPIAKFYDDSTREGRPNNFGAASSWTFARVQVFHDLQPDATLDFFQRSFSFSAWQTSLATPEQLERIIGLVEGGLREGGVGIGINAGYAPSYGRKEYYELARLAARFDVPTFTHVRYASVLEPLSAFEAMEEVIALAAITGAHMHICHLNSSSMRDVEATASLIETAQARGIPVTTEAYPYGAASTAIGAQMFRGADWEARFGGSYGDALYMEFAGQRLTRERVTELQQSEPGALIVFHFLDPENSPVDQRLMDRSVLFPGGAIASDSTPWMDGTHKFLNGDVWPMPRDAFAHPRSAGTYARFLSRYVRDRQALDLKEGLAKCSLYPARVLEASVPQMRTRGRLQVGADADIVVIDLPRVRDNATFLHPAQPSSGFRHVLVNGVPVIEDGARMGDRRPGRGIRRRV